MRSFRFLSVLVSVLGCLAALPVDADEIVTILAVHYPPFEMAEPVDGLRGFDHEVVVEAFRRRGIVAEIQYVPWKRAIHDTQRGVVAGALSCAKMDSRMATFIYSDPISAESYGLFSRKDFDGPDINGLDDLVGQRVASIPAYSAFLELEQAGVAPIPVPSDETGFNMLSIGRIDYLYTGLRTSGFLLKQIGLSGRFDFSEISVAQYHLCLSKAYPGIEAIRAAFNAGLAAMKSDGSYTATHDRYR